MHLVMILIVVVAWAGCAIAAFKAAGGGSDRKAWVWSTCGLGWAVLSGVMMFFQRSAFRSILLKMRPELSALTANPVIPQKVMFFSGLTVCTLGIILFLWCFNCRKNSSKWYWAALWSLGIAVICNNILFAPLNCGSFTFLALAGLLPESNAWQFVVPFFALLGCLLTSALLWTWHTLQTGKKSWKNILLFAGCFTGFVCIFWLLAWLGGVWACRAVDKKAAALGIRPVKVTDRTAAGRCFDSLDFYRKHPKYQPPRSGKYDWRKGEIPGEEKEYTLKMVDSPELENYLAALTAECACLAGKEALYLPALNTFRSLVRHRADKAELYSIRGQKEKAFAELLMYPELEGLIPADTPWLISELVRTAARSIWINALVCYAPEEKAYLPACRKLLEWSKSWRVRIPGEAGYFLTVPEPEKNVLLDFFKKPGLNAVRYRKFTDAVNRIPQLEKMAEMEIISGDDMFARHARKQRLGIVLCRTALALKVYGAEHGRYPATLSGLVPRYLEKEYVSPYSGKKLSYETGEYACPRTDPAKDPRASRRYFILSSDDVTISSKE